MTVLDQDSFPLPPTGDGHLSTCALGSGWAGSFLLHAVAILMIFLFMRTATQPPQKSTAFVPVDVVRLGSETTAPPAQQKSLVPQQRAARMPTEVSPPQGVAPRKTRPAPDDLETKLRTLSKLRQTETVLTPLDNTGASEVTTTGDGVPGNEATYSLRDYVRAQVLRRWSLDLATLGRRNFIIVLNVEMSRNGTITKAEIADKERYANDHAFHAIALSARNALILASPIALPPGEYDAFTEMTLRLNPRDALR